MSSSKNSNVHHQTTPDSPTYYRPLLQLDNSPSWTAEQHSPAHLDRPPSSSHSTRPPAHIQHEAIVDDNDDSPIKHDGRLLSVTPTRVDSSSPRSVSSALSPSPTSYGHVRSPVLVRQPTMLENFSRTVRNYVPTSIPVPIASPSPPRISRPVSLGGFMGANPSHSPSHSIERDFLPSLSPFDRIRTYQSPGQPFAIAGGSSADSPEVQKAILGLEDGDVTQGNHPSTGYPTVAEGDSVLWSRWDSLPQRDSKPRRVLFLGYPSGFQMWDCTNLASVSEMLNLFGPSWGYVTFAGVLPSPHGEDDRFKGLRPLIGVISRMQSQSVMLIYSMRSHEVVKQLPFHNVSTFTSNNIFTVISITNPPTLHILSSASLTILHTISSSSIFSYNRTSTHKPNTSNTVSLSGIDTHDSDDNPVRDDPVPIYSLSHRLFAFAAQPPRSDSHHGLTALQPRSHTKATSNPFGISQSDLGNAAIKVGGSVLNGMKSFGGMAYNAAAEYAKSRSGVAPATPVSPHVHDRRRLPPTQGEQHTSVMSGVSNLFFSRSAPASSSGNHDPDQVLAHDRAHLRGQTTTGDNTPSSEVENGHTTAPGFYVKVLDLRPLMNSCGASHPQVVTEFVAAQHQPISHLTFTHDGNSLLVGPRDGQVVRIFQIRRAHGTRAELERKCNDVGGDGKEGKTVGAGAGFGSTPISNRTQFLPSSEEDAPWHIYNLRRGRTSAVIRDMQVSPDGRWVAVGSRKGTVHVFAINPYGGQPDQRSHMDKKIWNVDKPQPLSVELAPIVRLRSTRATGANGFRSDLSFMFAGGSDMPLPSTLLPPQVASSPSTSSGRSDLPSHSSHRQHNFKDVLVFDASGGVLSLRRITLEQRPRELGIPFSSPVASLATSISLPGVGAAGRLSASPPGRDAARKRSGLTQQMLEAATELVGKESTVATWQLKRRHDWSEVKRVMHEVGDPPNPVSSSPLAHAELSTCARSPGLVPRSIYLSHQFLFYTLGEDYHALIRRHRLAVTGAKIDARKEVEASASTGSSAAYFVEDLAFTSDPHTRSHSHAGSHGQVASSFDEPLASAMSAEMAYGHAAGGGRVTIPMLPNGAAQQSARARMGVGTSWSGSGTRALSGMSNMGGGIPIRVMEGVGGMIRREVDRVRGAARGVRGGGSVGADDGEERVPLEFDEQDEDFGKSGPAVEDEGDGEDLWRVWSEEDKQAVDEAERFDDVLGVMDEDQIPVSVPATMGKGTSGGNGW